MGARHGIALLGLGAAWLATACVRGPDVRVDGLALERVVIYRNGVGYFERQGRVDEREVTFKVRREKVGDFLATLAVLERGGSSVRSASFPLEVADPDDEDEPDERYEILLKPPRGRDKKAEKDKLATVRLALDGEDHDLIVGYVAETPIWRPSYRIVAGDGGKASLQAWGIVQNLSGEDWKGVRLSLVAGAPLAFQSTLERPEIPPRPIVTDQGEVIAAVPTAHTSLGERAAGDEVEKAELAAEEEPMPDVRGGAPMTRPARPGKKLDKNADPPKSTARTRSRELDDSRPGAPPPPAYGGEPRNVRALASVAVGTGTTRYDLPFAVDVPNESATMVLLVSKEVEGELAFLFAPDGGVPDSASHPFRVARFANNTEGLLERGPIAVFDDGSFLGQGLLEPLPPKSTATVPFSLDRSIAVEWKQDHRVEGARLARIFAGELGIERDRVRLTTYKAKNGGHEDARMLVSHARLPGSRLVPPRDGEGGRTEDNVGTGTALVPMIVPKYAGGELVVDERSQYVESGIDWLSPLADEAVGAYLADPRADPKVAGPLGEAWKVRTAWKRAHDALVALEDEEGQLRQQGSDLSQNLAAIERNKAAVDLARDLADRLKRVSARLDELTKQIIIQRMEADAESVRFRDIVLRIKLERGLPPKD